MMPDDKRPIKNPLFSYEKGEFGWRMFVDVRRTLGLLAGAIASFYQMETVVRILALLPW